MKCNVSMTLLFFLDEYSVLGLIHMFKCHGKSFKVTGNLEKKKAGLCFFITTEKFFTKQGKVCICLLVYVGTKSSEILSASLLDSYFGGMVDCHKSKNVRFSISRFCKIEYFCMCLINIYFLKAVNVCRKTYLNIHMKEREHVSFHS